MQYHTFIYQKSDIIFLPKWLICWLSPTFLQNVLHWHIVDTQSFPLEIPSYPKLWDGAYSVSERYTFADAAEIVRQVIFESTSLSSYYLHLSLFFLYIDYSFLQLCSKTRDQCIGWNWCSWTCSLMVATTSAKSHCSLISMCKEKKKKTSLTKSIYSWYSVHWIILSVTCAAFYKLSFIVFFPVQSTFLLFETTSCIIDWHLNSFD